MKKSNVLLHVVTIILFLFAFGYNAYKLYDIFKSSGAPKNELNYNSQLLVDYYANIKDNEFIKTKTMGVDKTYITKYVDNLHFTFKYNYTADKVIPLNEEHRVIATIYTIYNEKPDSYENPVIWEKQYILKNLIKRTNLSNNNISVTEDIVINLSDYNNEAIKFKESMTIATISYLELTMPVRVNGSTTDYNINENQIVIAKIPLAEEVFKVETTLEKNSAKKILATSTSVVKIDSKLASIHFLLIVGSLVFIFISIRKIVVKKDDETFKNYVNKLKKEFNDIVVETDNMVDAKSLKPIVITTFEELLNLANSLEMPIILYEEDNVACFYIVKGDIIYSYLVKRDKVTI